MILRSPVDHLSFLTLLLSILLLALPSASKSDDDKKDAPTISKHKLESRPASSALYFDDSDVFLIRTIDGNVLRSSNAGADFARIADVPENIARDIYLHPYDSSTAYIWGDKYWLTHDRGDSWEEFTVGGYPMKNRMPFSFHAGDPNKVIVNVCSSILLCDEMAFYTLDGFKTEARPLRKDTRRCVFARSTPEWGGNYLAPAEGDEGTDSEDRIVCVVTGRYVDFPFGSRDNRLVVSDDYYETEEEPILDAGRTVQGIVNIAVVKGFLVAAASAKRTDELGLYVTDDAVTWHRAVFPQDHRLEEGAYTVLESTNYSIQVDVMTTPSPLNAMGVLFTSNSNGTYFTRNIEHTNRNMRGLVDFEKVAGVQGIFLVNVVDNWEHIQANPFGSKKIKSQISYDDGRTFEKLTADGEEIHLHSVTQATNAGRVFSSKAPGLVMGVGNKGKFLTDYEDGNLYVSDDAGLTWSKALDDAHKYEFGDRGAVLLAIYDEGPTDEIHYSIDHGKSWKKVDLGEKVTAELLTTTPDSTSLKFLLMASQGKGSDEVYFTFSIDFSDYHKGGKCGESDFENWYARVDEKGEPSCIMGNKQSYRRRKADSKCFVDKEFEDPVPDFKPCACSERDFECDYNYVRSKDGKNCVPSAALEPPKDTCKKDDDTFQSSSGFRLIPGNACNLTAEDAVNKVEETERQCKDTVKPPPSGDISTATEKFESAGFAEYHYLERTDQSGGDDETVVMRTDEGKVYITKDAGKTWKQLFEKETIAAIYPHAYMNDVAFFLTEGKKVHYTYNRGASFGHFKAPEEPTRDRLSVLGFHPKFKDWLIWTGASNCGDDDKGCHNTAFFTEDRGANWEHQIRFVRKCEFIGEHSQTETEQDRDKKEAEHERMDKLLYCEQYQGERLDQPLQLKWSDNWFASEKKVFGNILDFATMSEFIVVAVKQEENKEALQCHASVDGKNFAHAQFPPTFEVPEEKAYTVLKSKSHAVFLHATVNDVEDREYGSLLKSNSNGTSYVMSLNGVNRDREGFVDFEKMDILEGVILSNIVKNVDDAKEGKGKKLATVITHNDGAEWAALQAPQKDAEGKQYNCDVSARSECSLHLHSFTERPDKSATFSSRSAIGLMMGTGNVGEALGPKEEADTFMSDDGGIQWRSVKKGNYLWKYGDQGSVIVIVAENKPTKSVFYTLNEGKEWTEYPFSEKEHVIRSISTVPSDKSRNFILWTTTGEEGKGFAAINIDFSGLTDKLCELDENNPDKGDYYLWSPRHPLQSNNCLFGHIAQYHRKNPDAKCYNGPSIEKLHSIAEDCECTRQDFECDYNFEIASDGSCQLVPGLTPPDHIQQCKSDPDLISYYEPTGYRRTPLDTCDGGRELQYTSPEKSCPQHEKEFEDEQRSKGLGGFWFFVLVFVLPVSIATGVGYWVYQNWDGKFGRIRLGDGGSGGTGEVFDADQPWIKYPIIAISGVVAVVAAIPVIWASAWRFGRSVGERRFGPTGVGRYTSRSDFARGGRYAVVEEDEDDLLEGDEGEEEV